MKFKTNKIFTKRPKTKIKNQKNMNWIWNTNNKDDQAIILEGGERKEIKKSLTNNKPITQLQQELPKKKEDAATLTMIQWNDSFGCWKRHTHRWKGVDASHTLVIATHALYKFYFYFFPLFMKRFCSKLTW
jgi:hypothetical protein